MAVSINEVNKLLRQNMGATGADALADALQAIVDALQSIATNLDDDSVGAADYEANVSAIIDD